MPQVKGKEQFVEVLVSDNASDDDTTKVVEAYKNEKAFNYYKNKTNEGPIANVIKCGKELATGKFVWVLGSHNLLAPNSINILLRILQENDHLNVFYTNFRCAIYPNQWPSSAVGGYIGGFDYLSRLDLNNYPIAHWQMLITDSSAACTQLYAHIVRTRVWQTFWKGKATPETYKTALGTYPHTAMIATELFNSPAYYIGEPLITIFNGAQTWQQQRLDVLLYGFTDLIKLYKTQGLDKTRVIKAKKWQTDRVLSLFKYYLSNANFSNFRLGEYNRIIFKNKYLFYIAVVAFIRYSPSKLALYLRLCNKNRLKLTLYFRNWRPARWFRYFKLLNNKKIFIFFINMHCIYKIIIS